MTNAEEDAYIRGQKALYLRLLGQFRQEFGTTPELNWEIERAQVVAMLREVCGDWGDNDWPDDLNLCDVIDKHLARNLHDEWPDYPESRDE